MINEVKSKIVFGGKCDSKNRYIEPTIILKPSMDSIVMQEEIFGPVLPIITFTDFKKDVLPFLRKGEKPLALYYFGN